MQPLSAFASGMDLLVTISSETNKIFKKFSPNKNTAVADILSITEGLTSIQETVLNIKNVNQFMLMTINRCIDYTKVC